jgi:hypothetical protein
MISKIFLSTAHNSGLPAPAHTRLRPNWHMFQSGCGVIKHMIKKAIRYLCQLRQAAERYAQCHTEEYIMVIIKLVIRKNNWVNNKCKV